MKIALISHLFPTKLQPSQGKFVKDQVLLLNDDERVNVALFVPTPIPIPFSAKATLSKSELLIKEVPSQRVSYLSIPAKRMPAITQLSLSQSFNSLLKNEKYDCVHVHFLYPSGLLIPSLKKMGFKTVLTIHGGDWYRSKSIPSLKKLINTVIQSSDKVLLVGPQLLEDLKDEFKNESHKFVQINNHVDEDFYTIPSDIEKETLKADLGWDKEKLHFLCVGNNRPEKGLDILVDAIKELSHLRDKVDFHIVGNLHDSFSENVLLDESLFINHSPVSPEELKKYYQASDAYLFPSRNEGFGLAMIEAASCGLPIVSNSAGIAESFVTDDIGILIDTFEPLDFAQSVMEMAKRVSEFDSKHIREKAIENFGNKSFKSSLMDIYKNLDTTQPKI